MNNYEGFKVRSNYDLKDLIERIRIAKRLTASPAKKEMLQALIDEIKVGGMTYRQAQRKFVSI